MVARMRTSNHKRQASRKFQSILMRDDTLYYCIMLVPCPVRSYSNGLISNLCCQIDAETGLTQYTQNRGQFEYCTPLRWTDLRGTNSCDEPKHAMGGNGTCHVHLSNHYLRLTLGNITVTIVPRNRNFPFFLVSDYYSTAAHQQIIE
jgi:hypothetical protein